jgi:hypothetical protein
MQHTRIPKGRVMSKRKTAPEKTAPPEVAPESALNAAQDAAADESAAMLETLFGGGPVTATAVDASDITADVPSFDPIADSLEHDYYTPEDVVKSPYFLIKFQSGPIPVAGVNGCQIEDLIRVCIDRLKRFQAGKAPCEENRKAIINLHYALGYLDARTRNRTKRSVEGTDKA